MTFYICKKVINCSQQSWFPSVALLESQSEFIFLYFCSGSDAVFFCCHTGKKMCTKPSISSQAAKSCPVVSSCQWSVKSHYALTAGGLVVVFTLTRLHLSVQTLLLCFIRLLLNISVGEYHFSIMKLLLLLLLLLRARRGIFHICRKRRRT